MPDAGLSSSPLLWDQGDAHGMAVASVMETRREIEETSRGRDRMVEERAFKPYVYHTIAGAGTALESALRHADSRVLVGRPRSSAALRNACLDSFEGFGAGSGDVSGLGTSRGSALHTSVPSGSGLGNSSLGGSPLARADCVFSERGRPLPTVTSPEASARSPSGLFNVSTRTLLSGENSASRS